MELTCCKGRKKIIATEKTCQSDAHQGQRNVLGHIRLSVYEAFFERIFHYVTEAEPKTSPEGDSEYYLICALSCIKCYNFPRWGGLT